MKFRNILPALIAIATFSSCATAYRTGQTPDDVYYSPARDGAAYASVDQRRDGRGSYQSGDYYSYDDRWLRMRVANPYRWSYFDSYGWNDWSYNPYMYNHYSPYSWYNPYSFNSYWNSYYHWNTWYNPYCGGIVVINPKTQPNVYTRVRNFSLNSYTNNSYNNDRPASARRGLRMSANPGYNNSNRTLGNSVRKVFQGNSGRDSYYSPSNSSRPGRTYTPSSSSSNSSSRSSAPSRSSSGGSSGGGVSRPSRGGN